MILKDELGRIAASQRSGIEHRSPGTSRESLKKIRPLENFAIVISGIRRCGKSTLLLQSMKGEDGYFYLNFEDPRLSEFELNDFEILEEVFEENYGENELYYFDEIQNLSGWESYVRYLLDNNRKVIITGSNASLLSREPGTKLTGRNLRLELFPFSYREYLKFMKKDDSEENFHSYLFTGGFPEYLRTGMDEVLQNLLLDIIARDILFRYNIKNPGVITEIAVYMLANISREFTLSKLRKTFSSIGSVTTIASYVDYLEDSYIIFTLPRFSYSIKSRQINPKKVYAVDNGFIRANSTGFSDDYGRLLENYVFLELRKRYREVFYFREKGECDFLVKENTKITKAVQVCYDLNNRNKGREINGLLEAMEKFGLDEGYILTFNQKDEITVDGRKISIIPAKNYLAF
ncbi:ATP-binding protein [Methanoplanus endosymbiosus]|uniref:ATP-binding protein n=1 Tax=Methanoplanus endosymbiosus TaxID=33865 RepID=A0A9E7THM5_9EURY|nr:ATP-binding protein [Methanoplanus endosymbiosus]UUX93237.1 ATP-binding protein [Methanoplanus endosymbiosus]